jgi:hypothetical protein
MSTRSRWLDWQPEGHIFVDTPKSEPPKLTKPGSVSFGGSISGELQEIEEQETKPKAEIPPVAAEWPERNTLKGQAVEVWYEPAGGRVLIVADEGDAQDAMQRFGARRGEIWTAVEIELVGRFADPAIRDEVMVFKRQIDGCLSPDEGRPKAANAYNPPRRDYGRAIFPSFFKPANNRKPI